ncbi:MAG: CopG family transcriptional regulator [Alcaligenaceae bacterium]|nr:CopG family transcriptional regulator [Alcaligenaceae bacterium]
MKNVWVALLSALITSPVVASPEHGHLTVYQDPNCGCCSGWVQHMASSGFSVTTIKTTDMASHKARLGVPPALGSCHTAVVSGTGQVIEGHVPANAVRKMLTDPSIKGVAAPGMPANSPGMGELDGNLVTVDFQGRPFSRD